MLITKNKNGNRNFNRILPILWSGIYSRMGFNSAWFDIFSNFCKSKYTVRLIKKQNNNMEKRKIEIDINTAKEWYNSNNESLKTIALQAFKEKELKDSLPKTWEEWVNHNANKLIYYIDSVSNIDKTNLQGLQGYKNSLNTKEDAKAHLALMQLHVLRDAYRDSYEKGWKPDWTDNKKHKHCIAINGQKVYKTFQYEERRFLAFPTDKLAKQFLDNFGDLIEKAKDLI